MQLLIGLILFAAWVTHIIHGFVNEQWGWLIGGMMFFPVGIINGIGIWLGIW